VSGFEIDMQGVNSHSVVMPTVIMLGVVAPIDVASHSLTITFLVTNTLAYFGHGVSDEDKGFFDIATCFKIN
jgi:hypothetical protein